MGLYLGRITFGTHKPWRNRFLMLHPQYDCQSGGEESIHLVHMLKRISNCVAFFSLSSRCRGGQHVPQLSGGSELDLLEHISIAQRSSRR